MTCLMLFSCSPKTSETSGNPLWEGWYADPEGVVFGDECWIYPTYSHPYKEQLFMDAFSSSDLVHWTKHERVLSIDNISWLHMALWAPSVVEKDGTYYFYFGANDVHEGEIGGIGVATADNPAGPFKDAIGGPLIGHIINGAQPIDQFVFIDDDGERYMYYGGWGHCNMVRLGEDMVSLIPFEDGEMYKEITPEHYVEGPFMLKRDGTYYFMWSEGGWGDGSYCVAYAMADSPFGPFNRIGKILQSDPEVGTGAGHHSVVKAAGKDEYYIVYHRHPLGATDGNDRVVCIDRLEFNADGTIAPVRITFEGVPATKLR
ncbi:MAG: family 43 glycosylhydrolase [Bacteroidales bacterium]|nr:family 43 glycosylhydrolase [Bacteroidales bacterium]